MILCADDFGLSKSVNAGILKLAEARKISAVACMVNYPIDRESVERLLSTSPYIDIGLHINISTGDRCPQKMLNISKEVNEQYKRFKTIFGKPPVFIDSHHHIHQYPFIRGIVARNIRELGETSFIRVCDFPDFPLAVTKDFFQKKLAFKSRVIAINAPSSRKTFEKNGFNTNRYLFGAHGSLKKGEAEKMLDFYLSLSPMPKDIFMIHPGYVSIELKKKDSLVEEREDILHCVDSKEFQRKIILSKF